MYRWIWLNEEGICNDINYCEEKKDGKCVKCKSEKGKFGYYCANEILYIHFIF